MALTTSHQTQSQAVLGLPFNNNGQFLITLRNDPKHPQAHNKWQVTGGGIEPGETPETALGREIKEELGVAHRILFPYPIAKKWTWVVNKRHHHVLLLCYIIDIGNQPVSLDYRENLKYRWINAIEVNKLQILPLTDDFLFEAETIASNYNLLKALS